MTLIRECLCKIPIWIQLHNLALELWTAEGVSYAASVIGMPLYTDSLTGKHQRLRYARVCVEIDADTVLPSSIDVKFPNGELCCVHTKYPWKPHSVFFFFLVLVLSCSSSSFFFPRLHSSSLFLLSNSIL